MTRILLVDDHAVVRQGLKQILDGAIAGAAFGDAASGEEALRMAAAGEWDVVVLDISLPGKSGLEVLKELRHARPRLPVLVLSMHAEEQFGVRVLRAGAAGYLAKRSAAADLVTAIRNVLAGRRYVSPSLAERLAGEVALAPGRAPHELLSDREFQVFRLLAAGKTVTASAEALGLSVPTVSTYRARILEKMGASENADLVHYAMVNRLFDE
ncbi:MAG TPA: response regulator transcription factor [Thermoanaerobaculia bacterium]|nr:response regulator transcription factor [Thermoanaerobaculia bacterium]